MINVLISEDELLVRMGILSMINWEGMGMKVVSCVSDGLAALSDALKLRPDIVITDIVMPGMDGISLLGALRSEGLRPTCIVITALHQRQAMERAEELGIVACLVKATMTQREIMAALMAACAHIEDKGADGSECSSRAAHSLSERSLNYSVVVCPRSRFRLPLPPRAAPPFALAM